VPLPISGRFWGIRQSVSMATSLAGLLLAGQILDAWRDPATGEARPRGFAIVFAIAACLGVTDIVVHHFVREPRPVSSGKGERAHRRILAPLANRDFRLLTLSLGIWNLGFYMTTAFSMVYLKRDFGVTYSQLAALTIAAGLGATITGYGFGEIMDRMGARVVGAILLFATPFSMAPWLWVNHSIVPFGLFKFPQSIALLSAAGIVSGAISSGILLCQFRLAAELFPPRGRTMSMAVHWSLVGLLGALGPFVGGLVMDHFPGAERIGLVIPSGLPFSFFHAQLVIYTVLLWVVALPLMLGIGKRGDGPSHTRGFGG
jgi:predicted MFS family arabinose efflux permease